MIELPESYTLIDQINKEISGKIIVKAEANHTAHAFALYTGDPVEYNEKLAGKTIICADVYSGSVRIKADDMIIIITTPIRYHKKNAKLPDKHQLYLEFEDATAITCTVQMWGSFLCFREGDMNGIPKQYTINTNPSPLEQEFDEKFFRDLLHKEKLSSLSAKAFLTTEQRIPGVGNGVAQDILYKAKIHPKRKMSTLSEEELNVLFNTLKSILLDIWKKGGRDTEYDLYGCKGGYKTIMSKYSVNKPCPVCNTLITKESYLGGSIYLCENCQKM